MAPAAAQALLSPVPAISQSTGTIHKHLWALPTLGERRIPCPSGVHTPCGGIQHSKHEWHSCIPANSPDEKRVSLCLVQAAAALLNAWMYTAQLKMLLGHLGGKKLLSPVPWTAGNFQEAGCVRNNQLLPAHNSWNRLSHYTWLIDSLRVKPRTIPLLSSRSKRERNQICGSETRLCCRAMSGDRQETRASSKGFSFQLLWGKLPGVVGRKAPEFGFALLPEDGSTPRLLTVFWMEVRHKLLIIVWNLSCQEREEEKEGGRS